MSLTAEQVKRLVTVGVTAEQLAVIAEITEEIKPVRSKEAERAKRYRENKRLEASLEKRKTVTTPVTVEKNGGGVYTPLSQEDSGKKDLEIQHAREPDEVETFAAEWNVLADELGLSKVQHLTETRRKAARKRLTEAGGMAGIREIAFPKIRASAGLQGKAGGRKWKANFDWLLQQSSFTKLMEGGYDHWQKPKSDLMEAADRLRERLGEKHRQDAQGRGAAGLFDRADGTGDLRDDHSCY